MKTIIDKVFTYAAYIKEVRADLKEFKARYTDNDLLNAYIEQIGDHVNGDIISAEVEGFNGNSLETCFSVTIIIYNYSNFYVINYYCNTSLEINTNPSLLTHRRYSIDNK